ncbi:MAG: L-threonine 3-dehydrogenase [Proteobacteria bacterium]|nr:L-threonine 3-dehydrogenase [Pseudomonadota bacterium]
MFAIVKNRPEKGLWAEDRLNAQKTLGPNDVRIKVSHAGVCGTDFHIYKWDDWAQGRVKVPTVLGHEFVGNIVEMGSAVSGYTVGERVSAECHITCGVCRFCRTGQGHLCVDTQIIGVDRDGAFTNEVVMPASNLWKIHPDIPDAHAAIFDPLGNAMHTVSAFNLAGKTVMITGAGAIGLMAVAMSKARGAAKVIVLEPQEAKRRMAEALGADMTLDPTQSGANDKIKAFTNAAMPDVLLEMSGNEKAIQQGMTLLAMGGEVAMLGIPPKAITLDVASTIIFKGLTVKGIIGRKMFETWYQVDTFVRTNPDAVDKIITHVLPAERFAEAFTLMEEGKAGKVVLKF